MLTTAVVTTLLLASATSITHATDFNKSYDKSFLSESPSYSSADCKNDGIGTKKHSDKKNNTTQSSNIDCMLTQLQEYQQNNQSARQQYFAYKAQAWLNYAHHKNSIKSRTAAASQALQAGNLILIALKNGTEEQLSIHNDIPTTSALMRPDLWATLNAIKDSDGIQIAPRELAFSEVALIWAAADQCEHGWRQSGTHFRMADRWLEQAREAYINTNDSENNVLLEKLANNYFKQYSLLDTESDICRGQKMSTQTLEATPSHS